jgi:Acyl-CoA synthetases (AMP-forming)/AMP-acid ligases II
MAREGAAEVGASLYHHRAGFDVVAAARGSHQIGASDADEARKQGTEQKIVDYCRQHLASFKVPRRVVFLKDWPMTGAGKIQRFVLKDSLARDQ